MLYRTSKTWKKLFYSVPYKLKPSTIPSRKCNNCIWASVELVPDDQHIIRPLRHAASLSIYNHLFLLYFTAVAFLKPNYIKAAGSNSILDQLTYLRAQGIYQGGGVPDSPTSQS